MLTVLLTSSRVAPGLLSWQAWAALREAHSVLASPSSGEHPQASALAAAGIEVSPGSFEDACSLAGGQQSAAGSLPGGGKPVVWLAPADSAGSEFPGARVLHGASDLPGAHLIDTVAVMDTLRVSCPWDARQTHSSLLKYLLEEAYEAAEAIETGDYAGMREELGDVLLQAVFHARVASERSASDGGFTIDDVADELVAKLTRRHPHVFGSVSVSSADDVNRNWEEIKKAEKASRADSLGAGPASVLDGVAFGQPALSLAAQLQRRAARAGFPMDSGSSENSFTGSPEGSSEGGGSPGGSSGGSCDGIGAELMRLVARAREAGADPELELRETARRFADRVRAWERTRG